MRFGITYNGERGMAEVVAAYLPQLIDVTFYPPTVLAAWGEKGGSNEQAYSVRLHEFLGEMKRMGAALVVACDGLCVEDDRSPTERIADLTDQLRFYQTAYGAGAVRIASPLDGRAVKAVLQGIRVLCSVNMFIADVPALVQVEDFADSIVVDRDINRNIPAIAEIRRRFGKEIRLLANEGCRPNCIDRVQHLNRLSHLGLNADGELPCVKDVEQDPSLSASPLIRPDEVPAYENVADVIELETRSMPSAQIDRVLQQYTRGEYRGHIWDLVACPGVRAYRELRVSKLPDDWRRSYDSLNGSG